MVGHRSVYASQKLGLSKSAGLEIQLGGAMGDLDPATFRIRKGSLTERFHQFEMPWPPKKEDPTDR